MELEGFSQLCSEAKDTRVKIGVIKEKYVRFVSLTSETLSKFRMGMGMDLWKGVGLVHASP